MSDNSVSFGSTTLFYKEATTPIRTQIKRLMKSGKFSEVKKIDSLSIADSNLKPGQVGLFNDVKGVTLTGYNAEEDKLIYDVLTDNGKRRLPGSQYITDHLDLVV